ncbi:MAG: hypothetical protein WKF76_12380 [Nocardioidaceae bacterium]
MADRYQRLTGTSVGRFLVKNLGLPDPVPLQRYDSGHPVLAGTLLVGGAGALLPPRWLPSRPRVATSTPPRPTTFATRGWSSTPPRSSRPRD